jgi:hypothetical protein
MIGYGVYILVEWIKLSSDSSSGLEAHPLLLFVSNDILQELEKAWYLLSLSFSNRWSFSNNESMFWMFVRFNDHVIMFMLVKSLHLTASKKGEKHVFFS